MAISYQRCCSHLYIAAAASGAAVVNRTHGQREKGRRYTRANKPHGDTLYTLLVLCELSIDEKYPGTISS